MPGILRLIIVALLALLSPGLVAAQTAPTKEKRIALVIGNGSYQAGALTTPANDAGLIAQTLEAAGFDVVGARDLDQDTLRRSFRDFLEKAQASGPNTVAFIYLSGYGLQLEGENYYLPIDAQIARESDIAVQAVRISDYTRPLVALNLKASIVVLDAARPYPFAQSGAPLAGGLALVEPEPGMMIAFNAAPDTVAPGGQGPYGPYAQALAEMMREGGLPLGDVFERVRLRVNDVTKGAEVPWHASKVQAHYVFFERAPDAPPPSVSIEQTAAFRARPIRDFDAHEAYVAALERDTLEGYLDFLAAYPHDPMAKRVRAIVAARREAITWHRTRVTDTPEAYWSYLRRYPHGRHASEARRRLAFLAAEIEPPHSFTVIEYDCPPPPPEEYVYIERRVLIFDDPVFAFVPPPPPPVIFLPPPPPEFIVLPPPPPPVALFVLPVPVYRPVPIWVSPPHYVAPPPATNYVFTNIHNTIEVNNTTNVIMVTKPDGQTTAVPPPAQRAVLTGTSAPAPALGTPLPASVAKQAALLPQSAQTQPQQTGQTPAQQPGQVQAGPSLTRMNGPVLPQKGVQPQATTSPAQPNATPGTPAPAAVSGSSAPPSAAQKASQLSQSSQPSSPEQPSTQQPEPSGKPAAKHLDQTHAGPHGPPTTTSAAAASTAEPAGTPAARNAGLQPTPLVSQKAPQLPQVTQPGAPEQPGAQEAKKRGQPPAREPTASRSEHSLPRGKELPLVQKRPAIASPAQPAAPGAHASPAAVGPAMPSSVAQKARQLPKNNEAGSLEALTPQSRQRAQAPAKLPGEARPAQPLPGVKGLSQALAPATGAPPSGQPPKQRGLRLPGQPLPREAAATGGPPIAPALQTHADRQRLQQTEPQRQKLIEQQRHQQLAQPRQRRIEQQQQPGQHRQAELKQGPRPPGKQPPSAKQRADCGGPQQPPCPR